MLFLNYRHYAVAAFALLLFCITDIAAQERLLTAGPVATRPGVKCDGEDPCGSSQARTIILLKQPSVAEVMTAEQQSGKGSQTQAFSVNALKAGQAHVRTLSAVHQTATQILSQRKIRVLHSYRTTINALVVNSSLSLSEAQKILPGQVRGVEEDREVKAYLNTSVPITKAPEVWKVVDALGANITGRGVRVGIIDTGIDYTHPDLGGCPRTSNINTAGCAKVAGGYDFANKDNDPFDDHGHGTHCAATAAGKGILSGMAPDATLYAYKVLSKNGFGSVSNIIAAIERSVDPNGDGNPADHLDVISLSLGADEGGPDSADSLALDRAASLGVIPVVGAGNSGPGEGTVGTPGTSRRAITVAASYADPSTPQAVTYFSSRGPVTFEKGGKTFTLSKPDVMAPGAYICAAKSSELTPDRPPVDCVDSIHQKMSGTSMATPHVAGLAALLHQAHPSWTPDEIKSAITTSASRALSGSENEVFAVGSGTIDAVAANLAPRGIAVIGEFESDTSAPAVSFQVPKGWSYTFSATPASPVQELDNAPWVTIASAIAPADSFTTTLNLTAFPQGNYTSRLTVTSPTGSVLTDYGVFRLNRFEFIEPLEGDVVNMREPLSVRINAVSNQSVTAMALEFAVNDQPWQTTGTSSNLSSLSGTIALPQMGSMYLLKVRARLTVNGHEDTIMSDFIRVEPRLLPGFPIRSKNDCGFSRELGRSYCQQNLHLQPVVADLEGDGRREILVWKNNASDKTNQIDIYNDQGRLVRSFPLAAHPLQKNFADVQYPIWPLMATDLDGDGQSEIVVIESFITSLTGQFSWARDGQVITVYDAQGRIRSGFPLLVDGINKTFLASDLNRDGRKEIVVHSTTYPGKPPGKVTIVSDDGTITGAVTLGNVPQRFTGGVLIEGQNMVVGNFDQDPDYEVAVFEQTLETTTSKWAQQIFILNWDQFGAAPSSTGLIPGVLWSSAGIQDEDNDGVHEISLPVDDRDQQTSRIVHLKFSPSGPVVTEFDLAYDSTSCLAQGPNVCAPLYTGFPFGQLKGSAPGLFGFIDSVFFSRDARQMRRFFAGQPEGFVGPKNFVHPVQSPPVFADVTGDGEADIIFNANGHYLSEPQNWGVVIEASESNYSNVTLLPTEGNNQIGGFVSPSIVDLNNDNKVEIVTSSLADSGLLQPYYKSFKKRFSIYAFSTDGLATTAKGKWTEFLANSDHNSCLTCSRPTTSLDDPAPVIVQQPRADTTSTNGMVVYSVQASGSNLRYQWEVLSFPGAGWYPLKNANANSLSVRQEDSYFQIYRVRVSSRTRSVMSEPTARFAPPNSGTVCPPGSLKIVAGVCGCQELDEDIDRDGTLDCTERKRYKKIPAHKVQQKPASRGIRIQLPALEGASRYTVTLRLTSGRSKNSAPVTKSGTGRTFTFDRLRAGTYSGTWTATISGVPNLNTVTRAIGPVVVK